jgi:hypothetical protein
MKSLILCLGVMISAASFAQSYSIDWYKIAGGGGASGNGQYSLSGTVGQPEAGVAMSGGKYSLAGGFWSLISVVQTPGMPSLSISRAANGVIVSWPAGNYTLQQNGSLSPSSAWITSGYAVSNASGTNSVTITPAAGNLFFRLANPDGP